MTKLKVKLVGGNLYVFGILEWAKEKPIEALQFAYILGRELGDDITPWWLSDKLDVEYDMELDVSKMVGTIAAYRVVGFVDLVEMIGAEEEDEWGK